MIKENGAKTKAGVKFKTGELKQNFTKIEKFVRSKQPSLKACCALDTGPLSTILNFSEMQIILKSCKEALN